MITLDYLTAASLLIIVILIYGLEAFFFWYKTRKISLVSSGLEHVEQLKQLQSDLDVLKIRLAALEHKANDSELPGQDIIDESVDEQSAYANAIKLAQQGVDAAKLVSQCGLSRAEADLIVAIYRGVYKG